MDTADGLTVFRNQQRSGFVDETASFGLDADNPVDFTRPTWTVTAISTS
jgi:hypothetical protein